MVDVIPFTKPPLGRPPKAEEPRKMTAMENEAKIVAERIRAKRDAIRTAVDGSLSAKHTPGGSLIASATSSMISSPGELSMVDEDSDSTLGPLKAASENLVRYSN